VIVIHEVIVIFGLVAQSRSNNRERLAVRGQQYREDRSMGVPLARAPPSRAGDQISVQCRGRVIREEGGVPGEWVRAQFNGST
jgi:hypothetical protein